MTNKEAQARYWFSLGLKALVVMLGIAGQVFSLARMNFKVVEQLKYYTNWSNLLVIALALYLMLWQMKRQKAGLPLILSGRAHGLRFVLTVGVLLTFVGFSLLLMPRLSQDYLASPDNLLVHNLVPLLAGLDFVLFPYTDRKTKCSPLWLGLLLPIVYLAFSLVLSLSGVRYARGSVGPYFFLDYAQNGWLAAGDGKLGVIWWVLLISAMVWLLAWVVRGLQELVQRAEMNR